MTYTERNYSIFDKCIENFDQTLRTLWQVNIPARSSPGLKYSETPLSQQESRHSAGLMRVDHAGEICAQALYQGQALTARSHKVKTRMQESASEENDHLAWCAQRLKELNSRTSYLNPAWYFGSLLIGIIAGICGDPVSLGFVAETERQVIRHLDKHLVELPKTDKKSSVILQQMREDEAHHANVALSAGATELPFAIKKLMQLLAKVMTTTAYYL